MIQIYLITKQMNKGRSLCVGIEKVLQPSSSVDANTANSFTTGLEDTMHQPSESSVLANHIPLTFRLFCRVAQRITNWDSPVCCIALFSLLEYILPFSFRNIFLRHEIPHRARSFECIQGQSSRQTQLIMVT